MTKIIDIRNVTPKRSSRRNVSSINKIARHHSATTQGDFWSFWNNRWKGLGWITGGYHEIILRDGSVQLCYDANMVTNGVRGHNQRTYHICVVGNGSFTDKQEKAFEERAKLAMKRFNLSVSDVLGHREFSGASTSCPGINMDNVRGRLKGGGKVSANKSPKPSSKPAKKQTKWTTISGNWTGQTLKRGHHGKPVEQLQRKLANNNPPFYPNKGAKNNGIDSYFGGDTEDAVRRFQSYYGLTVDGLAGKKTYDKLGGKTAKKKASKSSNSSAKLPTGVLRRGDRGEKVERLQRALNKANFKVGKVDGIYGAKTEDAVRRFQSVYDAHNVDGVYGPRTKTRLAKKI